MKLCKLRKPLLMAALVLAASQAAHAGPFSGVSAATNDIKSLATAAGAILGGLVTLIGGAIAAWKASHGEEFTKPLLMAIVAAAIAAVCVVAM